MEQQEKEPYQEEFYPNYPSVNLQQDNTPGVYVFHQQTAMLCSHKTLINACLCNGMVAQKQVFPVGNANLVSKGRMYT